MHHGKNQCKVDLPYPTVVSGGNDKRDIKLIYPLYSGSVSELTSILLYSFQHFVLDSDYPDVAEIVKQISIVEMHHLMYLGEAIKTLGGVPKYINTQKRDYWDAGAVNYTQDMCKALLVSLKAETQAYRDYIETAKKVCNPTLAALLERIAMDEKLHIEIFTDLINNCCKPSNYC